MRFAMALSLAAAGWIASVACGQFTETFDTYKDGSGIAGQGGWELWCPMAFCSEAVRKGTSVKPRFGRTSFPASWVFQRISSMGQASQPPL